MPYHSCLSDIRLKNIAQHCRDASLSHMLVSDKTEMSRVGEIYKIATDIHKQENCRDAACNSNASVMRGLQEN